MDIEEYVILVDDIDQQTGTAEKLDAHRSGALHRAFSIVIWNSDGRMLLQQRALSKYHSAGLWTNTCCGHPRPNEDVAAAAARRLVEEMGLHCPLTALGTIRYRTEFSNGLIEHEIVHVYRGLHNGDVFPNPDEANAYAWRTLDEVRGDVAAAPGDYSVWFQQYVAAEWPTAMVPPD
jgi:isopentenyl-diphosphate delta-isomerase